MEHLMAKTDTTLPSQWSLADFSLEIIGEEAVKTLGLGASVSSVHPRSAGQITTRFVPEKRLA